MFQALQQTLQRWSFTRTQQRAFLEDVSTLILDGVPAPEAIATIHEISSGATKDAANSILAKLAEGGRLADGMWGWFPHPIVEIIRAGEEGGTLAKTMQVAAKSVTQTSSAITTLLGSLTYPLVVVIMGLGVSVFIRHSVFINFSEIKPVNQWPANGQLLMQLSGFLEHWWWMLLIIVFFLGALIYYMLHELTGDMRQWIDKLPLLSLYRDTTAARFMETLGLLISNGIVFKKSLSIMQQRANPYLAWHLMVMEFRLSGGRENIADVLDTGLIRQADILRLKVIAKGKGLEHALVRLGAQASDRNMQRIQLTARITGGLLLAMGAGFAAFMIFAIYGVGSFVGT